MPPRARSSSLPEFLSNATLGEMLAAEIEVLATPQPDGHESFGASPAGPVDRARRSMLSRAAAEIRMYHEQQSNGEAS